jgi:tetratricopeptide (TPR) repeat protein
MKPTGLLAARAALERGASGAAREHAAGVARQFPDQAEAHFLMGLAEAAEGRVSAGIAHLQRAVALDGQGEYWAQLARLLSLVHRDGEAARALQEAERALPGDALSLDTMGCVYARLGDHASSVPCFEAAVALAPENRGFRYNLAVALSFMGRTAEAEAALEALIALDPLAGRPHHTLAGLRKQTPSRNHLARLEGAHREARAPQDRLLLGYALSKELEDVGEPRDSFRWLSRANAEHRAALAYDPATDAAIFEAVEAYWGALGDPPADAPADAAVFVIGMPRTGTTLVDRIIGSHPQMESVGELQAMPVAVKLGSGVRTRAVLDPETIRAAASCDMAQIGRAYLERAVQHRRDPKRRLIDKFPGNFFYVGLIARALPKATLVCLRRQPMDVVLSNFKNLFATTSRYYDYSYDLAEIAEYYGMRIWSPTRRGRPAACWPIAAWSGRIAAWISTPTPPRSPRPAPPRCAGPSTGTRSRNGGSTKRPWRRPGASSNGTGFRWNRSRPPWSTAAVRNGIAEGRRGQAFPPDPSCPDGPSRSDTAAAPRPDAA